MKRKFHLYWLGAAILVLASCAPATVYKVGDTGPAGGYIFYDQGSTMNGWRYMEVAPSDQIAQTSWGGSGVLVGVQNAGIGAGKPNTAAIVAAVGAGTYAAKVCSSYTLKGFSDWFLPSQQELALIATKLHPLGLDNFGDGVNYWTSTELSSTQAEYGNYTVAGGGFTMLGTAKTAATISVRAIREF
jgi:hypothetical protein